MERSLLSHRPLRQAPPCLPSPKPSRPRPPPLGRSAGLRLKCSSATYLDSINHEIQVHLEKALPIRHPLTVSKPMRGLTFSASRSVAPALCVAACELVGGDRARAIPTAAALHILHAWSYFRDHFPLSDGPMCELEPTISHDFGTNIELLTGDGMVPFGIELISRAGHDNPEQNLRVIVEITRAIGSQGIIHGQYLQAKRGRAGEGEWEEGWVETVREKKWEGLHGCAGACGAILGGGGEWEIGKLRKYGGYVGMLRGMREGVGGEGGIDRKAMEEEVRGKAVGELEGLMMKRQKHGGKMGPILTLLLDHHHHANRDEQLKAVQFLKGR